MVIIQHFPEKSVNIIDVHPEKLRLRLRILPQIEKKNTVDMLTDGILGKCKYRSGTVNSNTVNSKFHLIRSYCEYLARILSFHV